MKRTPIWKRVVATVAAIVTVLTGFNYAGLESIFAEEKSGYQIDVSYAADRTSAVLTGNTAHLAEGVEMLSMSDEEGTVYDPGKFNLTITENGTYTYTLGYSTLAPETGEQVEKTERLEVTVDQIQAPQAETEVSEEMDVQEAVQQPGQEKQKQPDASERQGVPGSVPVNILKKQVALLVDERAGGDDESTVNVYFYADEEKELSLNDRTAIQFAGGYFSEELPTFTQQEYGSATYVRAYADAAIIYTDADGGQITLPVTGVFPYQSEDESITWYYTINEPGDGTTDTGYGQIQVGYLVPEGAEIRLHYEVNTTGANAKVVNFRHIISTNDINTTTGTVLTSGSSHWKFMVGGNSLTKTWKEAQSEGTTSDTSAFRAAGFYEHQYVTFQFTMPASYTRARIYVQHAGGTDELGSSTTITMFDTGDLSGTGLTQNGDGTYSGAFLIPELGDVSGVRLVVLAQRTGGSNTRYFSGFFDLYDQDADMTFGNHNTTVGMARAYLTSMTNTTVGALSYSAPNGPGQANTATIYYGGDGYYRRAGYGMSSINSASGNTGYSSGGVPYTDVVRQSIGATTGTTERHYSSTGSTVADVLNLHTGTGTNGVVENVPVRNFNIGDSVTMRFEMAVYSDEPQFIISPATLSVDVYTQQGIYTTANYDRYTYSLPKTNNESVTYELPNGGTVTITCKAYNMGSVFNGNNVYGESILAGSTTQRRFQDGYMFTVRGAGTSTTVYPNGFNAGQQISGSTRTPQEMRWFSYDVTVDDSPFAFKLMMSTTGGVHQNAVLELDQNSQGSIQFGEGSGGSTADNITGSYLNGVMNSGGSTATFTALILPTTVRSYMASAGNGVLLGLKPTRGYSVPNVYVVETDNQGVTVTRNNGEGTNNDVGSAGRLEYSIRFANASLNYRSSPRTIRISAHPVNFSVEYWYGGSRMEDTLIDLGYGTNQARNFSIYSNVPAALSSTMGYYQVVLYKINTSGGAVGNGLSINNPKTGNAQWQTGDIINFDDVYDQALKDFIDEETANYQLRIVPTATSAGTPAYVQGEYTIYTQTDQLTPPAEENEDAPYGETGFTETNTYSVYAPQGAEVILTGFEQEKIDDTGTGAHYKLGEKSKLGGILTTANASVGSIYYLSAARVAVDVSAVQSEFRITDTTNGTAAQVDAWNSTQSAQLYTSVSGESSTVSLSEIFAILQADTGPGEIQGFDIRYGDSGSPSTYAVRDTAALELSTLPNDVWSAIFAEDGSDRGTVTLVPNYESGSKIVSRIGGQNTETIEVTSQGNYKSVTDQAISMSATFYYTGELETAYEGLQFAVTKKEFYRNAMTGEKATGNQYHGDDCEITMVVAYGAITDSGGTATAEEIYGIYGNQSYGSGSGNSKIKFSSLTANEGEQSLTLTLTVGDSNLTYQWDHDAEYTIHLWNDSNESGVTNTELTDWADEVDRGDDTIEQTVKETFLTGTDLKIPGVNGTVKVYPKAVTTSDTQIQHVTGAAVSADTGDQNEGLQEHEEFLLTTTFQIDSRYPINLQIGLNIPENSTAGTAEERARALIRTALMKQSPTGDAWSAWMYDASATSSGTVSAQAKAERTAFQQSGNASQITVTYRIKDIDETTLIWTTEHGASYEVLVWNETNADIDLTGNPQNALETAFGNNRAVADSTYSKVPSALYSIELTWKDPSYYVHIPSSLILTDDNGKVTGDGNSDKYAGAGAQVSMVTDKNETQTPTIRVQAEVNEDSQNALTIRTDQGTAKTVSIHNMDGVLLTGNQTQAEKSADLKKITLGVLADGSGTYLIDDGITGSADQITVPQGMTLPFWLNTTREPDAQNGTAYSGTMTFILTHLLQEPAASAAGNTT